MKLTLTQKASMLFAGLFMSLFVAACYNHIEDEAEQSDIPFQISSKITPSSSRMSGEQFEKNDRIGVFLLRESETLANAFISNAPFVSNTAGLFQSEKELYYPNKDKQFQVISYYPYTPSILEKETSFLHLGVGINQTESVQILQSDFLLAVKKEVRADYKPLALEFKHLLAKIQIRLKPSEGYTVDQLQQIQPKVSLANFPTKGKYEVLQDQFSTYSTYATLLPQTNWSIANGYLKGCELIVLPQESFEPTQKILIEAEGVMYGCTLPQDFTVESGRLNTLTLSYNPSKGIELIESASSVSNWEEGSSSEVVASEIKGALAVSDLDFSQSSVLNLATTSNQLAAIACEEFLNNEQLRVKAYTVYPVVENVVQLDRGVILNVESTDKAWVGASICWDKTKNNFSCMANTSGSTAYLFIDQEGQLCFEEPLVKQNIVVEPRLLVDKRGPEVQTYPLQKVGTQLWMKTDLNAAYNTEGIKFASAENETVLNAGYSNSKTRTEVKLYNFAALESNKLAPKAWLLAQTKDWQQVLDYVSLDVNTLKTVGLRNWAEGPAINISGLSIEQDGVYREGAWAELSTGFPIMEGNKTSIFLLHPYTNNGVFFEFRPCGKNYQGSIRCLQYL